MHLSPNLATGVAFDNFDRYVETLSGKNTLHDTVGIVYQDVDDTLLEPNIDHQEPTSSRRVRRRTYDPVDFYLEPYQKSQG